MGKRQQWINGSTVGVISAAVVAVGVTPAGAQSTTTPPDPSSSATPRLTPEPKTATKPKSSSPSGVTPKSRSYYIRNGDNLWTISRARLGSGASKAEVQRYLVRVWNLNNKRMRTDEPNLIPTHVTIMLPAVTKQRA